MVDEVVEELRRLFSLESSTLVVVEGKRDKSALESLGFTRVITLNKPLFAVVESIDEPVILLTDLDRHGRKLYSFLKDGLSRRGVLVKDEIRRLLFRTRVRQVEGLVTFLKKF